MLSACSRSPSGATSRTGTVDVAVVDARDPHPVEEMGHWLRAPVRMVRTSLTSMEAALRRIHEKPEHGVRTLAAPIWVPSTGDPPTDLSRTPAYGSPAFALQMVDESQLTDPMDDSSPTDVIDFPVPTQHEHPVRADAQEQRPGVRRRARGARDRARGPRGDRPRARPAAAQVDDAAHRPQRAARPFPDVGPILDAIRDAGATATRSWSCSSRG